jgi:hypothetical protein
MTRGQGAKRLGIFLRCVSPLLALSGGSLRRSKWSGIESLSHDLLASSVESKLIGAEP